MQEWDEWQKIGLLVPSSNCTIEADFARAATAGLSCHSARMWLTGSDANVLARMDQDLDLAVAHLQSALVDLLVYACTGGSLIKGPGYDRRLAEEISEKAGGIPTITTTTAFLSALDHLKLSRLVALTPYQPDMTAILARFITECGYKIEHIAGRNHMSNQAIGADPIQEIVDFAITNDHEAADGFFLSCTNWRAMLAAQEIEHRLGKPVVTANQATIWYSLKTLGISHHLKGYGRLLE